MKKTMPLLTLLSLMTFAAGPAALANIEHKTEHIQTMRQAANELQASNPELAKKLNDFADKKEDWAEKGGKHMAQKQEDIQKLRQASGALQGQNDALSKDLNGMADRWQKKLEEKNKKE